ncbi:unnamed protein product [Wuchereria bancrofti]|nr:unnamed protein product [Wuchereria bancrofti]
MPQWAKKFFIQWLPKYLCMQRPTQIRIELSPTTDNSESNVIITKRSHLQLSRTKQKTILSTSFEPMLYKEYPIRVPSNFPEHFGNSKRKHQKLTMLQNSVDNIAFIANHLKDNEDKQQIIEDWKYMSMVLDRIFLILFTSACMIGSAIIILRAPTIYDRTIALA